MQNSTFSRLYLMKAKMEVYVYLCLYIYIYIYVCVCVCVYTGRFMTFSVITYIYNKKIKGPTSMELFTATGKLNFF
jgi:hypothetical protein